jgi:hypothetical protein
MIRRTTYLRRKRLNVHSAIWDNVMYLRVPKVRTGDQLLLTTRLQVTNDLGYNCMISSYLAAGVASNDPAPRRLSAKGGFNVTKNMHHGVFSITDLVTIDRDYEKFILILRCRSASTASRRGDWLTIDRGSLAACKLQS